MCEGSSDDWQKDMPVLFCQSTHCTLGSGQHEVQTVMPVSGA